MALGAVTCEQAYMGKGGVSSGIVTELKAEFEVHFTARE